MTAESSCLGIDVDTLIELINVKIAEMEEKYDIDESRSKDRLQTYTVLCRRRRRFGVIKNKSNCDRSLSPPRTIIYTDNNLLDHIYDLIKSWALSNGIAHDPDFCLNRNCDLMHFRFKVNHDYLIDIAYKLLLKIRETLCRGLRHYDIYIYICRIAQLDLVTFIHNIDSCCYEDCEIHSALPERQSAYVIDDITKDLDLSHK